MTLISPACKKCHEPLAVGVNWYPSYQGKGMYTCIDCHKTHKKTYDKEHKKEISEYNRASCKKRKETVILKLGGKCVYCGLTDIKFLTRGHKNDNGAEHRRALGVSGASSTDNYLISHNFPEKDMSEFQVECYNDNYGKQRNYYDVPDVRLTSFQRRQRSNTEKVFAHFGDRCACCGESNPKFLTVGHKNNDGAKHKQVWKINGGYSTIYEYLVLNHFPDDGYELQTECCNCNMGAENNGNVCPHQS